MTFYAVSISNHEDGNSKLYRVQAESARIAAWVGFCEFINKGTSGSVDVYEPTVENGWFDVQRWFLKDSGEDVVSIEQAFDWQDLAGSVERLSSLTDVKFDPAKLKLPLSE